MSFEYRLINKSVGFTNILETLLENRGVTNIPLFLKPTKDSIEDIENYDNINDWINCYLCHVREGNTIGIIVDSDFDGLSSASLMYQYTKDLNPNIEIHYFLHEGKKHGIDDVLDEILTKDIKLLIVPDAGSNDVDSQEILISKGIDVLIADHHEKEEEDKERKGIVVNNQFSSRVKSKALTGVGVCYRIVKKIDSILNINKADDYLDLVACGMIADMSDLRDIEARYLVLKGIEILDKKQGKNLLLKHMADKQSYSMKDKVTISGVAFYISPLINCVTRMGTKEDNTILFEAMCNIERMVKDKVRGKGEVEMTLQEYAMRMCEKTKRQQKKEVDKGVEEILQQIKQYGLDKSAVLVCNGQPLKEKALNGLVANKLSSQFHKPCLVLKDTGNCYCGSARGFEKSSIKDFRQWCLDSNLFALASGHANAFGAIVDKNSMNNLFEYIRTIPCEDKLYYDVDGIYNSRSITPSLITTISQYDYLWGGGVKEPLFAITEINVPSADVKLIGAKKNTISFSTNGISYIKFNCNEELYNDIIKDGKDVNFTIIGKFTINEYNGNKTPQIIIEDMEYKTVEKKFRF